MTDSNMYPEPASYERDKQLNAMQIQLRSQRASDILRGMAQVRKWLQENPEDRQIYEILLDAVQENHEIRERVRDLFLEMMQKGSKRAEEAISILPSTAKDLLADADDAYYAAEYSRAVQLYLQVLKRVPDHKRAKEHLAKAKSAQQDAGDMILGLPRDAAQYYRRARSYLAASDFLLAIKSLNAAVEAAQVRGMNYPDAEELLKTAQDSLIADEYKQKANLALEKERWREAFEYIDKGLALKLADVAIKKELESLQILLSAELDLRKFGTFKVFAPLEQIRIAQKTAKSVVSPDNPLLSLVAKQLTLINRIRIGCIIVLVILGFVSIPFLNQKFVAYSITPIPTKILVTTPPSSSQMPDIYGFTTEYVQTYSAPNGRWIGFIEKNQFVTILARQTVGIDTWYFCQWEIDGVVNQGWVANLIKVDSSPTP